jgi:hypothetical protein
VDGTIGGEPDACIAVECAPGEFGACRGDNALTCNNAGTNYDVLACEYGCSEAAGGCNSCNGPECEEHIFPKYLPTICNQLIVGDPVVISNDATANTADLNCSAVVAQPNGPEICVLHFPSFKLEANKTFEINGSRVFALVADRDLTIDGILDASATSWSTNGPCGDFIHSGTSSANGPAGGGAGYRTIGASGGNGSAAAGNGGAATSTPPTVTTTLYGGTRPTKAIYSHPGGAGGGLTLISCRGTLSISGIVDAGGGGGSGENAGGKQHPADGGGSGGTIVLQGMQVNVTGTVTANGGGGGGSGLTQGGDGEDGTRTTQRARSGSGSLTIGSGGTSLAPPDVTAGYTAGGGSAGFIAVYTPDGVAALLDPFTVSPSFDPPGTVPTN